jgi:hypothetical protein
MSSRQRAVKEHLARPKNQKEWAERAGVKAKYMTMGFWTPRRERKKGKS